MNTQPLVLTSKQAIKYIIEHYEVKSFYQLAKAMSDDKTNKVKVQPIQLSNYFQGKNRMSISVAAKIFNMYGIIISDTYGNGGLNGINFE